MIYGYSQRYQNSSRRPKMKTLGVALIAILGAVIGIASFSLFQSANSAIAKGDRLWGLGWAFSDISQSNAVMYRNFGIAGIIVGVVVIIIGLVVAFRANKT